MLKILQNVLLKTPYHTTSLKRLNIKGNQPD